MSFAVFLLALLQSGCLMQEDNTSLNVSMLASSPSATYILTEEGDLYVSGSNRLGALGMGYRYALSEFEKVPGLPKIAFIQTNTELDNDLLSGSSLPTSALSVVVSQEGELWASGVNQPALPLGENFANSQVFQKVPVSSSDGTPVFFRQISTNRYYTVGIDRDGFLWGVGQRGINMIAPYDSPLGSNTQLNGYASRMLTSFMPIHVKGPDGLAVRFTEVAACPRHALYLDDHGYVWMAGSNHALQLGDISSIAIENGRSLDGSSLEGIVRRDDIQEIDGTPVFFKGISCSLMGSLLLDLQGYVWYAGETALSASQNISSSPFSGFTKLALIKEGDSFNSSSSSITRIKKARLTHRATWLLSEKGQILVGGRATGIHNMPFLPGGIESAYNQWNWINFPSSGSPIHDFTVSSGHLVLQTGDYILWSGGSNYFGQLGRYAQELDIFSQGLERVYLRVVS